MKADDDYDKELDTMLLVGYNTAGPFGKGEGRGARLTSSGGETFLRVLQKDNSIRNLCGLTERGSSKMYTTTSSSSGILCDVLEIAAAAAAAKWCRYQLGGRKLDVIASYWVSLALEKEITVWDREKSIVFQF